MLALFLGKIGDFGIQLSAEDKISGKFSGLGITE